MSTLELVRRNSLSYISLQVIITILLILCIVVYKEYVIGFSSVTTENLKTLSLISICFFIIQQLLIVNVLKSFNNPLVYFSIILYLFSAGQTFLLLLDLDFGNYNVFERIGNNDATSDAIIFYTCSYVLFHLGVLFSMFFEDKIKVGSAFDNINFEHKTFKNALLITGYLLIIIGIIPFTTTLINNIQVFVTYGYSGYYKMEDVRVSNLFSGFLYYVYTGTIFVIVSSSMKIKKVMVLFLLVFSIIKFLLGDRGDGIVFALSSYLLYVKFIQNNNKNNNMKNFVSISVIALLLMTLIPVISIYRHDNLSISTLIETLLSENPIVSTLQNLGSTLYPLAKTIELIPSYEDPIYGGSYFTSLLLLIPSIFRFGIIGEITSNPLYYSPANWIMDVLNMSYGPGFTPFAEAYLNFGWLGTIFMVFYGFLIGKLLNFNDFFKEIQPMKTKFFSGLTILCFLFFAMSSRGSFNFLIAYYFRYIIIPIIFVYIIYIYFNKFNKKNKV